MVLVDGADSRHRSLGIAFDLKDRIEKTVKRDTVRYSVDVTEGGDDIGSRQKSYITWVELTPSDTGVKVTGHDHTGATCVLSP
jgi:hypothetical protein